VPKPCCSRKEEGGMRRSRCSGSPRGGRKTAWLDGCSSELRCLLFSVLASAQHYACTVRTEKRMEVWLMRRDRKLILIRIGGCGG
jgi:hypothetical protein